MARFTIMLDGGFVRKTLQRELRHPPTAKDVEGLCGRLRGEDRLRDAEFLRAYFYDAPPFDGEVTNPMTRVTEDLSRSPVAKLGKTLLNQLELTADFAVRKGRLASRGWRVGKAAMKELGKGPKTIAGSDLVPNFNQKGVDMRIGLDMAWIALKRIADIIVLVTGDSDMVPAMKLARKEGVKVYVDVMGSPVHSELKKHADYVFSTKLRVRSHAQTAVSGKLGVSPSSPPARHHPSSAPP